MITKETKNTKKIYVSVNIPNALESIGSNAEYIKRIHRRQVRRPFANKDEISNMENSLRKIERNVGLIRLAIKLNGESIEKYQNEPYYSFFNDGVDMFIKSFNNVVERDKRYCY